jgi:hypothetical protein
MRDSPMQMAQGLASALVLAAASLTPGAHADPVLFNEHCAKCHARSNTLAGSLKGQTADDKASHLDAFLKTHYAHDEQVRAKIVAYLVGLSIK